MKCNNFFCNRYYPLKPTNCDADSFDGVNGYSSSCPQRKAFNRFKKGNNHYIDVSVIIKNELGVIKKELES